MEPDIINYPSNSVSRGSPSTSAIPQSLVIRSFTQAVNVLKNQTFHQHLVFSESIIRQLIELHFRTREAINTADISNLLAARSTLNPVTEYFAYIATLHASLAVVENDSPILPSLLSDFRDLVHLINPMWAHAIPERWLGASRHAVRLVIEAFPPSQALSLIPVIRIAAEKLCTTSTEIVPIHVDFLALCLHSKMYRLAATWLRQCRRLHILPSSGIQGTDVHLFHHYAALVFIGVRDFSGALRSARLALSVPAPSPGLFFNVVLHTYRMYMLLSLLQNGSPPSNLKHTSYQVGMLRKHVTQYVELANAFKKLDMKKLRQIVESNRASFEREGMLGLVNLLVDALLEQKVTRLSKSFMSMSLEDLAMRIGLGSEDAAQALILELSEKGKVNARIDERRRTVELLINKKPSENEFLVALSNSHVPHGLEIIGRLQQFCEELESDPDFIRKQLEAQKRNRLSNSGAVGLAGHADPRGAPEIVSEIIR